MRLLLEKQFLKSSYKPARRLRLSSLEEVEEGRKGQVFLIRCNIMEVSGSSNFLGENTLVRSAGALRGWDREPKKLWPTLQRTSLEEAWGFSLIGGLDYLEAAGRFSGIVTRRGDVGLWLKVRTKPFLRLL